MAKGQIFISYYNRDREFARRLRERLEEADWETRSDLNLLAGDDYDELLSTWLAESDFIVVLLSPGALKSENVRGEFDEGLRRERGGSAKVIPLLIESCPHPDLANFVGTKQYADFTGNFETAFKGLLASLSGRKGETKPNDRGGARKPMADRKTKIILAAIPVVGTLVGTLVVGYWQYYKPKHEEQSPAPLYFGRVLNIDTQRPIQRATVYVEARGAPTTHYSDSNGVFPIDADKSLGAVRIKVDAPDCKPFDGNVPLPERGVVDVRLQCSEAKPGASQATPSTGFTYDHNPTIDEVRANIQTVRKVSITYRNAKCEQAARRAVVRLNGAQLNGVDAKDILENGARPRTDLQFSVNIRQADASYEIVCAN